MIRKRVLAVMVLIAGLVMPAAALAGPLPAQAAADHLCEAYGHHYCVGSDSLDLYTHLYERMPGREINAVLDVSNSTYKFQFVADKTKTKCVASTNDGLLLDIRPCNSTGVVWRFKAGHPGFGLWINAYASRHFNKTEYLTGNNNGSAYYLSTRSAVSGSIQQFEFS